MTSRNFDPKLTPPLCHAKMGISPTSSYRVSQNHLPPSPYLRDVIYEWSLIGLNQLTLWFFQVLGGEEEELCGNF